MLRSGTCGSYHKFCVQKACASFESNLVWVGNLAGYPQAYYGQGAPVYQQRPRRHSGGFLRGW